MRAKSLKTPSWRPILSDYIAAGALIVSLFFGSLNYWQASSAIEISRQALSSQGPNVALAEEKMQRQQSGEYTFAFPFKNVGERSANDLKITMYMIGQAQNGLVIFNAEQEFANNLPPNVTRSLSGSLVTNPRPEFMVFDLYYNDELIDKRFHQRLFFVVGDSIQQLADPQIKESIEKILPGK